MSILPLLENSIWPGRVRSSKLPVGISVIRPTNGIWGTGGMLEVSLIGVSHLFVAGGIDIALSRGVDSCGSDCEFRRLWLDSASVQSVVLLSRVVKLEGARPESLRLSSGRFNCTLRGSHCCSGESFAFVSRVMPLNCGWGGGVAAVTPVTGIGGRAAAVSS